MTACVTHLTLRINAVLWRGDAGIPGAREAIELLRSLGKRVVFVVRFHSGAWACAHHQTNSLTTSLAP